MTKKKINTRLTLHGEIPGMDSERRIFEPRSGLCEVCNQSTRGSIMKHKQDNRIRFRRFCNKHSRLNVANGQPVVGIHRISTRKIEDNLTSASKAYIRYFTQRFIQSELPPVIHNLRHEEAIRSLSSSKEHRHTTSLRRGYSRDGLLKQMTGQAISTLDEDRKYKIVYRLVLTALFAHLDNENYQLARRAERVRGLNDVRWFLLGKSVLYSLSVLSTHQSFKRVSLIGQAAIEMTEVLAGLLKESGIRKFEAGVKPESKVSQGMVERFLQDEDIKKLGYYHRQLYLRELMNEMASETRSYHR